MTPIPPLTLHKASGQARVRTGGHDYYLGKYGTAEALARYAQLLADLAAGQTPARTREAPLTVSQALLLWWARDDHSCDAREIDHYRRALQPLLELYARLPVAQFDSLCLLEVQRAYIGLGWCRNHINRCVVRVRTVFRWLESRRLVPEGRWHALRTVACVRAQDPRVPHTRPVEPAAWDTVRAVLRHCRPVLRSMLLLQWWSGCRCGELVRLNRAELDCTADVWLYRPAQHKMSYRGQQRVIALGKKAQAALRPWLARAALGGPVFRNRLGRAYSGNSYAREVQRAARKAGVSLHPYQCRHAFKLRVTRRLGLDAARAALGQQSPQTTASYARQQDVDQAQQVARQLG